MDSVEEHDRDRSNPHLPLLTKHPIKRASSSLYHKWTILTQDWWLWELIAAATAVGAIAAIVIVLLMVDNSPRPDWPSLITINSVISFFATIAKLAIASVVGSAINQSKWLWYRQDEPKPIQDLQAFDDASRGPLGAAMLPFTGGVRHLVFVGCILVISTLLFDPFIQQIVVYPDHAVATAKAATVSRSERYIAFEDEGLPLPSVVDLSMKGAIYNGIFAIKDEAAMGVSHSCPTGNCSYPQFSSLAVCNTCVNITGYVQKSCNDTGCYRIELPNGPSLSGLGGQINASLTEVSPELGSIEASLMRLGVLVSKSVRQPDAARALECAFFFCVNRYNATVSDSVIAQRVVDSWRNDSARTDDSHDLIYRPPASFLNPDEDPEEFNVSALAAKALRTFMLQAFTGSGGLNESGSAFSSDIIQALYKQLNLSERMDNLATSMTNNIREHNSQYGPVIGTAWDSQTYVKVRWAWFSFPAAILVLTLLFLAGSMIETSQRKVLVWKSSNLALLFHGRGLDFRGSGQDRVSTVSEMNQIADDMDIRLVQDDEHTWQLSQE